MLLPVPPLDTVPTLSVPLLIVVTPEKVLLAFRSNVPVPFCVRFPVPVMPLLAKSVPWVTVSVRLKTKLPLLTIALLAESDPVVLPFPSCKVPVLIRVPPV